MYNGALKTYLYSLLTNVSITTGRLGNEKYKSKVVYKTLNPSWLEQFDLHLYDDQSQELEVTVWDKDRSKDDFMGRYFISIKNLQLLNKKIVFDETYAVFKAAPEIFIFRILLIESQVN